MYLSVSGIIMQSSKSIGHFLHVWTNVECRKAFKNIILPIVEYRGSGSVLAGCLMGGLPAVTRDLGCWVRLK